MEIKLSVPDINKLTSSFRQAPADIVNATNRGIKKSIILINQRARGDKLQKYVYGRPNPTPKRPRTGNLRNKWDLDFGNLRASTGPQMEYGLYLHEGTRYIHPPRPFLSEAAEESTDDIQQFLSEELDGVLARIAEGGSS